MDFKDCLRCGLPKEHQRHDKKHPPAEGWHSFKGQDYLDALEDGLLFVREKHQPHQWEDTGIVVDTAPSFNEKRCVVCGTRNWGGFEGGVCFGNRLAVQGATEAHNRRAFKLMAERSGNGL